MVLRIQIAKFKFCQYQLRANSPNLMLARLSRYTVYTFTCAVPFMWGSLRLTLISYDPHLYLTGVNCYIDQSWGGVKKGELPEMRIMAGHQEFHYPQRNSPHPSSYFPEVGVGHDGLPNYQYVRLLVWPARPLPPLQIILVKEESSNSCSILCAARYHPHTSV